MNRLLLTTCCCTAAALVLSYCGKKKNDAPSRVPNQTVAGSNNPPATPGSKVVPAKGTVVVAKKLSAPIPGAGGVSGPATTGSTTSTVAANAQPAPIVGPVTSLEGTWETLPADNGTFRRMTVHDLSMKYEVIDPNDDMNYSRLDLDFTISAGTSGFLTQEISYTDADGNPYVSEFFIIDTTPDASSSCVTIGESSTSNERYYRLSSN